jgi:hypothetical protein
MPILETNHALEFLLSEAPGQRSREAGTLNSGQNLVAGAVLGRLLTGAGAKVSGTGDGTVGAVTVGSDAQVGIYVLTGLTEAGNGGTFSVRAPNGSYLPNLTVASAYVTSQISLTVADGAADWDIGDIIHVTVTGGDYEALDTAATDGTQTAAAILCGTTDASTSDQGIALIVRDAEVSDARLTWPIGISAANKAVAVARLASRGVIVR